MTLSCSGSSSDGDNGGSNSFSGSETKLYYVAVVEWLGMNPVLIRCQLFRM